MFAEVRCPLPLWRYVFEQRARERGGRIAQ
jgi:hypothetical protein